MCVCITNVVKWCIKFPDFGSQWAWWVHVRVSFAMSRHVVINTAVKRGAHARISENNSKMSPQKLMETKGYSTIVPEGIRLLRVKPSQYCNQNSFSVIHPDGSGHIRSRPRLRNLLHAWKKLKRYKKLKKERLEKQKHTSRENTKHKVKHKSRDKKERKLINHHKPKQETKIDKVSLFDHGRRHHHLRHKKINNGTRHDRILNKSHEAKIKDKTIHAHNTTEKSKSGWLITYTQIFSAKPYAVRHCVYKNIVSLWCILLLKYIFNSL